MTVLDFPSAPTYGQVYNKWTWDGGRWTCGLLPPPPPTIYAIDPTEAVTGSAAFVLTVVGTNYLADSVINYGGSDQPTTFQSANVLTATVTPPAQDETKMVYVRNGANVSTSVPLVFTAASPPPEITVPAGAAIHIDFVARGASDHGTLVSVETLVGNDPACPESNGFNSRGYSAEGYGTAAALRGGLALIGSAKAMLLAGATMVVKYKTSVHLQSMECYLFGEGHILKSSGSPYNGTLILSADDGTYYTLNSEVGQVGGADTYNTMAIISLAGLASTMWGSSNGNPQIGSDAIAYPAAWVSDCVAVHSYNNVMQSITIYDAIDPAALPGLSGEAPPVGGEKPAWVREGALMAIDFRTPGKSWDGTTEGDGTTGIAALIGNDPDATNYAGVTGYNASGLNAAGYDYQIVADNSPAYIGALKTAVLGECSVVITIAGKTGAGRHAPTVSLMSADALAGIEVMTDGYDVTARSKTGLLDIRVISAFIPPATTMYYRNRIGFTITATRFDAAANGFGSVAGVIDATDRPADKPFACVVEWGNDIEMIEVFPPCADANALNILTSLN